MTLKKLSCEELAIDFNLTLDALNSPFSLLSEQPRLSYLLEQWLSFPKTALRSPFLLLKGEEDPLFFDLLANELKSRVHFSQKKYHYFINENQIILNEDHAHGNFSSSESVSKLIWSDAESLFGCVRTPDDEPIKLQPGALHKANGGILILGLRSLLMQPLLFDRLKKTLFTQQFLWQSNEENQALPYAIPALPMDLQVILVSDRQSLSDLQIDDTLFFDSQLYSEFEFVKKIKDDKDKGSWLRYIHGLIQQLTSVNLEPSGFPIMLQEGFKYCEDRQYLPLSPTWLKSLLSLLSSENRSLSKENLIQLLQQQKWGQSYLEEILKESILSKQVNIQTQGSVVGQINGLSVIEYPGYPNEIGEPARITSIIHSGDGDLLDIERKSDLAGSLHTKGMMIMYALLSNEFSKTQSLPFTASLVFEQSYNEIDGDSASLAGLCAILSALSNVPIDQQIAVTGSIDQFGNVQSIGGVNQKIRGFFDVCQDRGLTGKQGVIIPATNERHLCLEADILTALRNESFHIWSITHFSEAVELLMGIPYKNESPINLYQVILTKMKQLLGGDKSPRKKWFSW